MNLTDLLSNIPWRIIRNRRRLDMNKQIELYRLSCDEDKKEDFKFKFYELKNQYWDVSQYSNYLED